MCDCPLKGFIPKSLDTLEFLASAVIRILFCWFFNMYHWPQWNLQACHFTHVQPGFSKRKSLLLHVGLGFGICLKLVSVVCVVLSHLKLFQIKVCVFLA